MDIGNLKNNYTFYEGYEDENEIVLYIETDETITNQKVFFLKIVAFMKLTQRSILKI